MTNDTQARILTEAHDPLIAQIWRAMAGLRSVVGFMNTGAHPDDETSAMLAALWLRDGVNLSYACSTRGEGGQNDIGAEAGDSLGVLRTAEMEKAAEVLDMALYWHSTGRGDTITDFRFSKSGVETMAIWGRERLMARFVHIVRTERPDIICPTFLDIPGQHGHHRAMTEAAHDVIAMAADPAYAGSDLPPWQVAKLYLPAWSGAGGSYDDEVPPPPATVHVPGRGHDPVLGLSYEMVGQWSRQFHRSQGMGRWIPDDQARDWPLHLVTSTVGQDENSVLDNLPLTLADVGCESAADRIEAILSAFPDRDAMVSLAIAALADLDSAAVDPIHAHRVERARAQLARLIHLAAGIKARVRPERPRVSLGESLAVTTEVTQGSAENVTVDLVAGAGVSCSGSGLNVAPDAPPSDPQPDHWHPLKPRSPHVVVTATIDGRPIVRPIAFDTPFTVMPQSTARMSRTRAFVNLAQPDRSVTLQVQAEDPTAALAFDLPDGVQQDWSGSRVTLSISDTVAAGHYDMALRVGDTQAHSTHAIAYDHVPPRVNHWPASLRLSLGHVAVPDVRVGYIGTPSDALPDVLRAAGLEVIVVTPDDLAGPAPFAGLETVLVGVFAYRFQPALGPRVAALNAWVRDGGTLVTLYHRPWDAWDPDATPPARIEIGQPSLRWRITDAAAEVAVLVPDHPVFNGPNRITSEDWEGWQKERGLYFAKSWAETYQPLVRMADPDEAPLDGGLLVGAVGQGIHAHVALNLHHQMAEMVPGAYRLMANLLALRGRASMV